MQSRSVLPCHLKYLSREPLQEEEEERAQEAMFATPNGTMHEEEVRMVDFYNNAPRTKPLAAIERETRPRAQFNSRLLTEILWFTPLQRFYAFSSH